MRDDSALLEEHEKSPPSFSVHLYPAHWTLNNGTKFLYNQEVSSILEEIRAFRIPTDFIQIFDDASVPYYSGCLIVELLDYRPAKAKDPVLEKPDVQRVVLRSNPETIWADICMMNAKANATWSDMDALKIEAKLLLSTSTPLCLDPDPHLTRIVNSILRVSTPNVPNSLKRKAAAMVDLEEDETEKAKRAKMLQYMNPQANTARKSQSFKLLAFLEQRKASASQQQTAPQSTSVNKAPVMLQPDITQPDQDNGAVQASNNNGTLTVTPISSIAQTSQTGGVSQPVPMKIPQVSIPPHLQQVSAPSQRMSPVKQQQPANILANPQQIQAQSSQQPATFNPSIPPSNFLNPPPPSHRRMSVAVKPSTPAATASSLPVQQPVHQVTSLSQSQAASQSQPPSQPQPQSQPQSQSQPQLRPQSQPQLRPQSQPQLQPQSQPQQPQAQPQPHMQPQALQSFVTQHHAQNISSLQNIAQYYQQNGRTMPISAQAVAAAAAAHRQAQSGRSTPASVNNPRNSPALPASAMAHSPMLPAAAAALISGRSTPAVPQVARGSPLATNHPVASRTIAAQSVVQQQPAQQPMPNGQQSMLQPGAHMNPTMTYQQQIQYQQQQNLQAYLRVHGMQGLSSLQSSHASPASQQQLLQQAQQPGTVQVQQPSQEQTSAAQTFANMQMGPRQMYNYMQMNAQAQHQHVGWAPRIAGRGVHPMAPQLQNGQQLPVMPPGMSLQQMQGLGRAMPGSLQNR
ncbi:hypothetical protein EW145_g2834 [Phellinidium pouzarii]|uniref:Spt20-like SEP domain-containing protein n=1 Tax=Phellinidium pouzarii TaxID=167371 RepID=A0A4S4L9C0_9AGAM|nr:hypothetical protein EW145_g2834 [Phellinidium pouzarii]